MNVQKYCNVNILNFITVKVKIQNLYFGILGNPGIQKQGYRILKSQNKNKYIYNLFNNAQKVKSKRQKKKLKINFISKIVENRSFK